MIFFPPLSLFLPLCLYFFPLRLHFFPPRPCNYLFYFRGRCTGGKYSLSMFFPLVFILPFFLDSFLDMSLRRNNIIFPPGPVFFLLVTEKLVKKLRGERKLFFSISIFFPHGPCCIWFPFSDSYGTEVHENDDIYPWLKCTFFCL